jgi:hypothetical protein
LRINCSESSGITIILVGVALLSVTFFIACVHLQEGVNFLPVPSFATSLGEGLSPLIEAVIRALYLGLMGWIASTVTAKGIKVILTARKIELTFQKTDHI